jgi:anaerobic selenocysteine-containing dehydrogenase
MKAIGSPMTFSPSTTDSPGKLVAKGLHGVWQAPGQAWHEPDVALLFGNNPLVSHQGRVGNPRDYIKDLRQLGAKLIVVDPRLTETAKRADLFLQSRPGEDAAILAGMSRVIIEEKLYDSAFVAENVTGFEELRATVEPLHRRQSWRTTCSRPSLPTRYRALRSCRTTSRCTPCASACPRHMPATSPRPSSRRRAPT